MSHGRRLELCARVYRRHNPPFPGAWSPRVRPLAGSEDKLRGTEPGIQTRREAARDLRRQRGFGASQLLALGPGSPPTALRFVPGVRERVSALTVVAQHDRGASTTTIAFRFR